MSAVIRWISLANGAATSPSNSIRKYAPTFQRIRPRVNPRKSAKLRIPAVRGIQTVLFSQKMSREHRLPLRQRRDGRTAMALRIDGSHAEDDIVFGNGQRDRISARGCADLIFTGVYKALPIRRR